MSESLLKILVLEGGAVFKTTISAVPKEYLNPTMNKALKDSGFGKIRSNPVGNISKPFLGDVDIAVEFEDLVKLFGSTKDKKDFWEKADIFMKKQKIKDYSINKGLQQIHVLSPLVDKKGKQLPAVNKEGKEIGGEGWVQIDFMIGRVKFMKDMLSGTVDSKYKAAWRNQLLVDILANTSTGDGDVKHKFQVNRKDGLQYVRYIDQNGKKKKLNVKTVSTDMDEISSYIFGKKYKWKDVDTFEKMWKAFKGSEFRWASKRKQIIKTFTDALKRQKMELPSELNEVEKTMNKKQITEIAEIILEELENKNEKLIKLIKSYEERLDSSELNEEIFIEETERALREHLGFHDDTELTKAESELERMRRLMG